MYDLVYKVAEAEGAVVKLTEQLASSETRVAKLEGIVEELSGPLYPIALNVIRPLILARLVPLVTSGRLILDC